jgi:Leucine-rich repeat (LRR) protein
MDFKNLGEYYEYLENDTNFQYLDLNTYKYITVLTPIKQEYSFKFR